MERGRVRGGRVVSVLGQGVRRSGLELGEGQLAAQALLLFRLLWFVDNWFDFIKPCCTDGSREDCERVLVAEQISVVTRCAGGAMV